MTSALSFYNSKFTLPMTRVRLLLLVCFASFATFSNAHAQEFKLRIFADFKGDFPLSPAPLVIGYDPIALDTMFEPKGQDGKYPWKDEEAGTGEQEWPGFFDAEIFLYDPATPAMFGKVSIKNKPVTDTFTKVFDVQASLGTDATSMVLRWNKDLIPAAVRHITLTPKDEPLNIIADLKNQGVVTIPKANFKSRMQLTIYHNLDLPQAAVKQRDVASVTMSAYPNPAIEHSKIMLGLPSSADVSIQMFDVQGRLVMQQGFFGHAGMNEIGVEKSQLGLPAGMYFVRATIEGDEGPIVKTLQINLQ